MNDDEKVADVKNQAALGADAEAGGSSAAAIADPPEDDQEGHASPDNTNSPVAGEQDESTPEGEEVETKPVGDIKEQQKARTTKRFQTLLEEKKQVEQEAASLKAQLAQSLGGQAQPPADAVVNPPQQTAPVTSQPADNKTTVQQFESLRDNLYAQYKQAEGNGDQYQMQTLANQYNATQTRLKQAERQEIVNSVVGTITGKQRQSKLVDELIQIDQRFPILKRDEGGRPQGQIDPSSPLMRKALRYAQDDGVPVTKEHLYRAQSDFLLAGATAASTGGNRIKSAAQNLMGRTGLEGSKGSPPPSSAKSPLEGMSTEQLREVASKQARGKK